MAAIFQIRRGTSDISSSIVDGELYLHKGKGSIQFGSGSNNPITLLPLNAPVVGDIDLSGSISASGDIRIGGNIYLGNSVATDNISALGIFTTNLVPNGTIDLGTLSAKWNNAYINNLYAGNGVVSGSSQILGGTGIVSGSSQITYANISSIPSGIFSGSSQVNADSITNFDTNVKDKLNTDGVISGSSQVTLLLPNGVVSGSSQISLGSVTGNSTTNVTEGTNLYYTDARVKTKLNVETVVSGSSQITLSSVTGYGTVINQNLLTTSDVTHNNLTLAGNLIVNGTTTTINSTTVQIGDNIIELNGTGIANGGLLVKDPTGGSTISGSLLWDSTNDYWKGGTLGNESKLLLAGGDSIVSGSSQIIPLLPTGVVSGSSQITYTSISSIPAGIVSGSTQVTSLLPTGVVSGSSQVLGGTGIFSGSSQVDADSITNFDSNVKVKLDTDGVVSGSSQIIYTSISSIPTGIVSGSSQVVGILNSLNTYTGSNDTTNTTQNTRLSRLEESTSSLNTFSASINAFYNQFTASAVGFSASVDGRLDQLEYTASYGSAATIADQFGALTIVTSSLQAASASLQLFTSSQAAKNIIIGSYTSSMNLFTASVETKFTTLQSLTASNLNRLTRIEESTASLNLYTSSNDTTNTNQNTRLSRIEESTASLNLYTSSIATAYEGRATATKTIFSGSSQVSYVGLSNIPSGIISSSAQIDTLFNIDGIVSGSSQINFTQLSGISNGIVSSSTQITPLLPTGVLSGSNQTNITSINQNLGTTSTGVQFATLGIGTAPDATYELKIAGDIAASGDIVAYYTSDKRLKDNIQPIQNALDKVNELGGYTFDWNEELQKARKGHDIGVIAQEVQSVLPEVVVERDNGYLGVDYQKLVPVLIEAIKELSAKIKDLENK